MSKLEDLEYIVAMILCDQKAAAMQRLEEMRITDPAPVRDAAESAKIVRVDDCLASVLASAECDCIPNEFQCVKHGAMDELNALRARVAGLEGELKALRESNLRLAGEVGTECGNLKNALDELTDARALLAVERERVIEECANVCDAFAEEDRGTSQCVGASLCADRIRALAQPRAERET